MDLQIVKYQKDAQVFINEGNDLVKRSNELNLTKSEDSQVASMILKDCQITEQQLEEKRLEITKPLNDFVKEVNTLFKETALPIIQAKSIVKQKILEYNQEKERIRLEEERKRFAEEQARLKKLEDERLERERIERLKREEEERKLALERARLKKLEDERIAKEMAALKASDDEKKKALEVAEKQRQEREALENERLELQRQKRELDEEKLRQEEQRKLDEQKKKAELEAEYARRDAKVKGVYKLWQYEITDEQLVPREFCSPDSKKINESIKKGVRDIKGLRIFQANLVR